MFIFLCSISVNKCKENLVGFYCNYQILKLFSCFPYTTDLFMICSITSFFFFLLCASQGSSSSKSACCSASKNIYLIHVEALFWI